MSGFNDDVFMLQELLPETMLPKFIADKLCGNICLDSRQVAAGDVFVALNGQSTNGELYIDQAFASGAALVLVDQNSMYVDGENTLQPVIGVPNLADKITALAQRRYRDPTQELFLVGVTGTNGKSSTVSYIAQLFSSCQRSAASIGTLGTSIYTQNGIQTVQAVPEAASMTTPNTFDLHRQFRFLAESDVSHVAMEVSSHGLAQRRIERLVIDTAVFTNLSQDHLDYHGTLAAYKAAKRKLFEHASIKNAVINIDDEFGQTLINDFADKIVCISYGIDNPMAQIRASQIDVTSDGCEFILETPWGSGNVRSTLMGEFNIYNLLAAIGVVCEVTGDFSNVLQNTALLQPVAGRMQRLSGAGVSVIIDYAHTPDALEKSLQAAKGHCQGKLWLVFGCGGDRDKDKRSLMGAVAERYADNIVVTSDNPRSEKPEQIVKDILLGCLQTELINQIADRKTAIDYAIDHADTEDLILVAGKGHEQYQVIGAHSLPFSDSKVAEQALERKKNSVHGQLGQSSERY